MHYLELFYRKEIVLLISIYVMFVTYLIDQDNKACSLLDILMVRVICKTKKSDSSIPYPIENPIE